MYEPLLHFPTGLFAEFERLQRALNPIWGAQPSSIRAVSRAYPPINVARGGDAVLIDIFVPGADPAKLDVQVDRGLLTISGERETALPEDNGKTSTYATERYTGRFTRAISLSDDVDPEAITARYTDGVLRIAVRRRGNGQPRRIEIQ
ncbi:Hsp20/alpha crystallin family protein [Bordetella genomosp. 9]|uniref:Heat-shock protein Hsp20 n=1 Tax=Bordetella genomosp. 9 TaxID=1416803 RepID=A0A1W6Z3M0_9BORD|nr:Hsp20/alpha crystallin family protein [Bordetella genomosp. 9]ARP87754.1 heat-shock protein Hsp20 [Bordetella genomosp. 9]ARP91718.1 heat-shock protein Hsp20 [Bordetella genomosp. 9]